MGDTTNLPNRCQAKDSHGAQCALPVGHDGPHKKPRAGCQCPNVAIGIHRIGCPGVPPPLADQDHPLLVELLDLLEPECRPGESIFAVVRRLKRDSERLHEMTWNREGRDVE